MTLSAPVGQTQVARARIGLCAAAIVLAALGGRYGLAGWWAKYAGVALWSTCLYLLVLLASPRLSPRRATLLTVGLSWCVEIAQLTWVPAWLSGRHIVLGWVFGSCFSVWDLAAYVAGAALGSAIHFLLRHRASRAGP